MRECFIKKILNILFQDIKKSFSFKKAIRTREQSNRTIDKNNNELFIWLHFHRERYRLKHEIKTERWIETEKDRVGGYQQLENGVIL